MLNKTFIKKIRADFKFLKKEINDGLIHSILLFGSYAKDQNTIRSDIDICIVAPNHKTIKQQSKLLRFVWQNINADIYDVRIFESMPDYMKIDIIKNHKLLFSKNKADLYYYFYFFRKRYNDQSVSWIEA